MTPVAAFLMGCAFAGVCAIVGFVWINRNQAARLDELEAQIRNFNKE